MKVRLINHNNGDIKEVNIGFSLLDFLFPAIRHIFAGEIGYYLKLVFLTIITVSIYGWVIWFKYAFCSGYAKYLIHEKGYRVMDNNQSAIDYIKSKNIYYPDN